GVASGHPIFSIPAYSTAIAGRKRRIKRINPGHLSKNNRLVLPVSNPRIMPIADVVGITAVTVGEVKVAIVRSEGDMASIMVEKRMIDPQYFTARVRINDIGITSRNLPFG